MKKLTRKRVTAAGIIAGAMVASSGMMTGCIGHNEAVYGPPPSMEFEENVPEAVYGPPEYFETDENFIEDVYGPPEYFE